MPPKPKQPKNEPKNSSKDMIRVSIDETSLTKRVTVHLPHEKDRPDIARCMANIIRRVSYMLKSKGMKAHVDTITNPRMISHVIEFIVSTIPLSDDVEVGDEYYLDFTNTSKAGYIPVYISDLKKDGTDDKFPECFPVNEAGTGPLVSYLNPDEMIKMTVVIEEHTGLENACYSVMIDPRFSNNEEDGEYILSFDVRHGQNAHDIIRKSLHEEIKRLESSIDSSEWNVVDSSTPNVHVGHFKDFDYAEGELMQDIIANFGPDVLDMGYIIECGIMKVRLICKSNVDPSDIWKKCVIQAIDIINKFVKLI